MRVSKLNLKRKQVLDMCEALEELYKEKFREAFEKDKSNAIKEALAKQNSYIDEKMLILEN